MGFVDFILSYLLPLVLVGFLLLKYRFSYWKNKGVPSSSPLTPLGDLVGIGTKFHITQKLQMWYDQVKKGGLGYGGIFSTLTPVLLVTDFELLKHIYIKDFNYFTDRDFYHNEKDDPLSVNLLTLEGERWKRRRNLLTPLFTSGKLKNMFHVIAQKGDDLTGAADASIAKGAPVEAMKFSRDYTLKSIGSCAFGVDLNNETGELTTLAELAFGANDPLAFIRFLFMTNYPGLARRLGMRLNDRKIEDFVMAMIRDNIKFRQSTGTRRNDLLDLLLDIQKEQKLNDEEFTFEKLAAEASIFFFGGFETSAGTMSWALFELAQNPTYQERLRDEIHRVKAMHGGNITYEAIAEMEYLQQIFNETLRLYPPFPTGFRKCVADYKLPNTDVALEKGTVVWIPAFAIQHDPEFFPNPNVFNPENFSPEAMRDRSPLTFLAFGEGPRNCVGMRFAQLQSKVGIVTVIDKFKVSVNSRSVLPVELDLKQPISIAAKGGMWIDFERVSIL